MSHIAVGDTVEVVETNEVLTIGTIGKVVWVGSRYGIRYVGIQVEGTGIGHVSMLAVKPIRHWYEVENQAPVCAEVSCKRCGKNNDLTSQVCWWCETRLREGRGGE